MAVYNKIYYRKNKTNLARFQISDGIDDNDNSWSHASVVQGSILHCYKYVKESSSDTASNTVKFYCPLSELTNGVSYKFWCQVQTGDSPKAYIISSTGSIIETLRTASYNSFTKTSDMDRILVTVEPTQTTKITTFLCLRTENASLPYQQKITSIKGTNLKNAITGSTESGEKEIQIVMSYVDNAEMPVYSKTLPVWGYCLENAEAQLPNATNSSYVYAHGDFEYGLMYFIPKSASLASAIFNCTSPLIAVMIPEGVDWTYTDIFKKLASEGKVYVPEDSPVLKSSSFYKKFIGWTLYIYDTSIGDVVSKKLITESTQYAN